MWFFKKKRSGSRPIPAANVPIPGRPITLTKADGPDEISRERIFTSAETRPTITEITNPIDWRDSPIGSRWGPGRCNEACQEVHAYAVKTAANTVSFERPCESSDLGVAEWRARQKR